MKLMGMSFLPANSQNKISKPARCSMSLWSLIESMQRRLEAEGLEHNVVDTAVTEGLRTLLSKPSNTCNGRDHARLRALLALATPTTAH